MRFRQHESFAAAVGAALKAEKQQQKQQKERAHYNDKLAASSCLRSFVQSYARSFARSPDEGRFSILPANYPLEQLYSRANQLDLGGAEI